MGSALGDAIGEMAFRYPSKNSLLERISGQATLTYTDDTAMTIGIAESLRDQEDLDAQHLGNCLIMNYQREPWRGYAAGPPAVFSMVSRRGISYTQAAKSLFSGEGSYGNGAAMRVAPVALRFFDAPDLYEKAQVSASVTHAHPLGIDGAAVQAKAVAMSLSLDPGIPPPSDTFLQELIEFSRNSEMKEKLGMVRQLLKKDVTSSQAARELGRSIEVHRSLPFALYSFFRHSQSFTDCLFCAVLNGGDRDTLGAMASAASGAFLGLEAIPQEWRQKLENHAYIEDLARQLTKSRPLR